MISAGRSSFAEHAASRTYLRATARHVGWRGKGRFLPQLGSTILAIMGSKSDLLRTLAAAGGAGPLPGAVPSLVPHWRTGCPPSSLYLFRQFSSVHKLHHKRVAVHVGLGRFLALFAPADHSGSCAKHEKINTLGASYCDTRPAQQLAVVLQRRPARNPAPACGRWCQACSGRTTSTDRAMRK